VQLSIPKIRQWADGENPNSLSNRLRSRRFALFESLVASLPRPLRILDIGGTNEFWKNRGWVNREEIQITTLNLQREPKLFSNVESVVGDATDLRQFRDASFDITFSNSVIEHLFNLDNQKRMAHEVQRVGKAYWVQTPNFWFPIEPHFHVLGWQWMPLEMRVALIRRWKCGWRGPYADPEQARQMVREVRLMTKAELCEAFPDAEVLPERFAGLIKSWVVIHGFPATPNSM
jgi:Methyltransferase domain